MQVRSTAYDVRAGGPSSRTARHRASGRGVPTAPGTGVPTRAAVWRGIGWVAGIMLVLLAFAYFAVPAVDPDYGWHVANGRSLVAGTLLRGVDTYSWTAPGATWIAHEWLAEGAMAVLHDGIGPVANSLLVAGLGALAIALVVVRLARRGHGPLVAIATGVLALLDAGTIVSVRPIVVEVLGVALLLALLDAWLDGAIPTRVMAPAIVALTLAWANLHGSFAVGLGAVSAVTVMLGARRDRRVGPAAAVLIGASAVTLLNPFGMALAGYVLTALTGSRLESISEWAPPDLRERMWWAFDVALVVAGVAAVAWVRTRVGAWVPARTQAGTERVPPRDLPAGLRFDDLLIAGVLAIEGLLHARHAGLFVVGAAPVVAAGLATGHAALRAAVRNRRPPRNPNRHSDRHSDRHSALPAGLAVPVIVAIAIGAGWVAWARVGPAATAAAIARDYPVGVLPALDAAAHGRAASLHLFNDYAWGGWLELERPAIPVFIDGRSEVYGDDQVARYVAITRLEPGWDATLDALAVQAVLMPADSALVKALLARGWVEAGRDEVGTLVIRPGRVALSGPLP